jgi:hypothetical protein
MYQEGKKWVSSWRCHERRVDILSVAPKAKPGLALLLRPILALVEL